MAVADSGGFNLLRFEPKIKILHLTWFAFFLSFVLWFNHAPLMAAIRANLGLSDQEVATLLILNVAIAIPARIIVGMLVDKLGPRIMFSSLLAISGALCLLFAMATDFTMLALTRFLMGLVGAGFVVGIRMIGEWFPAKQMGLAQGVYGGWGNFGSAGAALTLPSLALLIGGDDAWRWAIGLTGLIAIAYAAVYYFSVTDTPKGSTYFKPKKIGALEVTSRGDFFLYNLAQAPLFLALALTAWKLGPDNLKVFSAVALWAIYASLAALYGYTVYQAWLVNAPVFRERVPEIHRYKFSKVAVLSLAYMVTFGGELAIISMLPLFFKDTFGLSLALAGFLAGSFAFTNFFARPGGGWLSDKFGRKVALLAMLAGSAVGYLAMSAMSAETGLIYAVAVTMACSLFVNANNGAVFAIIPFIKRRLTGQIAGMAGAYGNVGAVVFLTVLSFTSPYVFFLFLAASAALCVVAAYFLIDEPKGQTAEILPDGTVAMIEVS